MNALANSVFSILFSWLRSLVEAFWRSMSSGSFSGTLTWLGDHWVIVVVALCVICTVLDYLVWLIRWRPYVMWRQKIAKWLGRSPQKTQEDFNFDRGYLGGVDIEVPERAPAPAEAWEEPLYAPSAFYQPSAAENPPDPLPQDAAYAGAFSAPAPVNAPLVYPAAPQPDQAPAVPASAEAYPVFTPADALIQPAARRRRSDRHGKKSPSLPEKLLAADDEEYSLLDGLPPLVNSREAFHRPVYPEKSGSAPWAQPQDENEHG